MENVVREIKTNFAPGPDGFSTLFFKSFWGLVKHTVFEMLQMLHQNKLDITRLNYGVLALIPKIKGANQIKQFRPICLLNVDYKCFTKVLTNRLVPIAKKVVGKQQTCFIKGRNIFEGVVVLHEVLHKLRTSKRKGLIMKIDFEKAYDRVRWSF